MKRLLLAFAALLAASCATQLSLTPPAGMQAQVAAPELRPGSSWRYAVSDGFTRIPQYTVEYRVRTVDGNTVTVDVAGKVRRPGVRTLPAGSRVVDALERAGGPRGRVDLTGLNLARVLVDGEQILVGKPAAPGGIAAGVASNAPPSAGSLVNLNTATGEQLETLPGVGPVTAEKIWEPLESAACMRKTSRSQSPRS